MFIRLFIFIYLWLNGLCLYSQSQEEDIAQEIKCKYCEQINVYDSLAWSMRKLYPDSTIFYSKLVIGILKEKSDTTTIAKYYNYQGVAYYYLGDNFKSYELFQEAFSIATRLQDSLQLGYAMNNLGRFYGNQGDYSQAYIYGNRALNLFEKMGQQDGIAYSYKRIAELYAAQGYYQEALIYSKKDLDIRIGHFNESRQANAHLDLALIYFNLDSIQQTVDQFNLAKQKAEKGQDVSATVLTNIGLSKLFVRTQQFNLAIDKSYEAISLAIHYENNDLINQAYLQSGIALYNGRQYQKAEGQFAKLLRNSENSNLINLQKEAYFYLAEIYAKLGDGQKAFSYQKQFSLINDTFSKSEGRRVLDSVNFVLQLENRASENAVLKANEQKSSAELELKQLEVFILVALIGLGVFLLLVFIRIWNKQKLLNKALYTKNKAIEKQYQELKLLNKENTHYKYILENVEESIYEVDANGKYFYVTPVTEKMTGFSKEALLSMDYLDIVHPANKKEVEDFYNRQIKEGIGVSEKEFLILNKDGESIWFRQKTIMEFDDQSKLLRILAVGKNINELKKLSIELDEQLALFRLISENSQDLIGLHELDGTYRYVSPSIEKLLGYSQAYMTGKNPYDIIHPDDGDILKEGAHVNTLKGYSTRNIEYRLRNISGEYIWFEAYTTPIFNEKKEVISLQTSSRNITQRKLIYRQIQENEANLTALVENTDDIIFSLDKKFKLISFNDSFKKGLLSLSSLGLVRGDSLVDKIDQQREKWNHCFDRVIGGEVFSQDFDVSVDEGIFEYECSFNPIVSDNTIIGLTVFGRNVTNKRREERKTLKYQEGLKLINKLSINTNIAIDDLLTTALSVVSDYLNLPIGIVSRIADDRYFVQHYFAQDAVGLTQNQEFKLGVTYCDLTLKNKGVTAISDMANSAYSGHPCFKDFQLASYIGAILYVDGEKYGTVNFSSLDVRTNKFDELDEDFMVLFTNWVGATILQYDTNEQLQLEKEKAERAAKAKADFLSVMSHEIRTPLSGIIGITDILLREDPRKDQFKNLNLLKFSGDNLLVIINDILDFNKIEANKIVLEQEAFNLFGLLESIQQTNNFKIDKKEVSLLLEYDQQLQQLYVGDVVRLGQVLNNLTSNAIKFTKKGSVTLEVSLVGKYEDYHSLKIAVIDTGKGIKEENFAKIFEDYGQEEDSTSREYGGTGLGLPISQKLLNLMGSEIQLDSKLGQGSNFYFYIDFPIVPTKALIEKQIEVVQFEDLSSYGLNVLVVDDNEINYTIAANFLENWGVKANHARSGQLAIDLAKEHEFDLILMDLQMPEMDGYEAAAAIRKFNNTVPIIALTASQLEKVSEAVTSAGMNDLLRKPMTAQQLYGTLTTNLHIEYGVNSKALMPLNSLDIQYINIEKGLNGLSLNDATFKKKIVKLMLLNLEELKTVLTSAVHKNERKLAESIVHKVKMTLDTLQLTSLSTVTQEIIDYIANGKRSEEHESELVLTLDQLTEEVVTMLNAALNQIG